MNEEDIKGRISNYYHENDMEIVESDRERLRQMEVEVMTDHRLVQIDEEGAVRHNNKILAQMIYDIALREISTLQYRKK
ncbi:hypothetical protein [Salinicoccus sp. CNSTN-B1]